MYYDIKKQVYFLLPFNEWEGTVHAVHLISHLVDNLLCVEEFLVTAKVGRLQKAKRSKIAVIYLLWNSVANNSVN